MPDVGDTWTPSLPFPLTDRELKEIKDKEREEEREKNRIKNANRRAAKKKPVTQKHAEAGKTLRRAFGGAFGRAPENVKYMASQGTTLEITEKKENLGTMYEESIEHHALTGE